MGPDVVLALGVAPEAQVEIVESRDSLEIQAIHELPTQGSPEPLDLALAGPVAGAAVHQVDVERGAQHAQIVAAEAGVIVQQEGTDDAAARDRVIEHGEEAMLGLAESGFEIRDDAAAVVEQPEDDDALRASGGGIEQDGAVKRVSLPELSAHGSFPTVASRAVKLHARAGQAAAAQQPRQGRDSDLAAADAAGHGGLRPGGQICQQAAQLSPSQVAAEQLAEDSVSEQGFLDAVIIVHRLPPGWFR